MMSERGCLTVRHVLAGEHDQLRALRLAALLADPDAFGTTHARTLGLPAQRWRTQAQQSQSGTQSRTFIVVDADGTWVGMALVRADDDRPGAAMLNGMWVASSARGQGAAALLCDACAGWARAHDFSELVLAVVVTNAQALRAYERAGFEVISRQVYVAGDRTLDEFTMVRALSAQHTSAR